MANPIIMTIDDDPQVLNAIERDIRSHYGREYRILKATSGAEALDTAKQLARRNDSVALFLSDQRMPEMTGSEFLGEVMSVYPQAKKVLLTAYADTNVAITSINDIGLDYYLMKPWDPPENNLYPVLDDLLSDWQATAEIPYDGIRVAGTMWSATSHEAKDFLARNSIPYRWLDIEKDDQALKLVEDIEADLDRRRLPVVFFPDGSTLVEPTTLAIAEKVGLQTRASRPFYDLIIVGGGPAGLGAGVYGAAEGLRTAMIEREAAGGQAGTSSRIENYLGFPNGISGADLARRASTQVQRLGVEVLLPQSVTAVRVEDLYKIVELADGTELTCRALIVCTGMATNRLRAEGVDSLTGAGVYYGASLTEAASYRDRPVYIVGGANSAGQSAMLFSKYASQVTMLVRAESLQQSMSQYLIDQIAGTDNIEVLPYTEVGSVEGGNELKKINLRNNQTGEERAVDAAAMFIFVGARPHSDLLQGVVQLNDAGFILTGDQMDRNGGSPAPWPLKRDPFSLETSVPGIFAAGDVQNGAIKRVATAVGMGAIAVSLVHQYLATV
ncbi:MAG: FAD-dependent oxidoreductase [Chloroflexi bacterium]|nr:FAD-dependent oxidoreductase [Chloroflexota bacterium]